MAKAHRSTVKLVPHALNDGSGWFIQATWYDASRAPEQIGGFSSDTEAIDWIVRKSAAYFFSARKQ